MNLLLLSSSKVGKTEYLAHTLPYISDFLPNKEGKVTNILFIPFAGVSISYDAYLEEVVSALSPLNINVTSLHQAVNDEMPNKNILIRQIEKADAILVGGGNTFALLKKLYDLEIFETLQKEVKSGKPYIGWSAGSNIAGKSIKTTNDMPIVEPPSFNALNLIPYQLNPHYIENHPKGHNGETRQQRIEEFLQINPSSKVIGIPEGTALKCQQNSIIFDHGAQNESVAYIFSANQKIPVSSQTDLLPILENLSN